MIECGDDRISQVPGRPQSSVCTCSSTPTRRSFQTRDAEASFSESPHGPRSGKCKGSRIEEFRSSITWLSDWLSTLRRVRYLTRRKTRFWPLVRRYQTGFSPAGSLSKVSDSITFHHPPSPSFLAQSLILCLPIIPPLVWPRSFFPSIMLSPQEERDDVKDLL